MKKPYPTSLKKIKLDVTVPQIFRGLKFLLDKDVFQVKEIQGNIATADNGKIGINMSREDGEWYLQSQYKL